MEDGDVANHGYDNNILEDKRNHKHRLENGFRKKENHVVYNTNKNGSKNIEI